MKSQRILLRISKYLSKVTLALVSVFSVLWRIMFILVSVALILLLAVIIFRAGREAYPSSLC